MKKNFRFLALSAAILSMFIACQREELEQNQDPEAQTHTVTFVAGSPETKTTAQIDEVNKTVTFAWTAEDVSRFNLYENSTRADRTQGTLTNGIMTIKAEFEGGVSAGENTYVAVLNSANDLQILYKEAYAEDADILVSKAVTSFNDSESVLLQFKREVAIAKMTLRGLDAGEVVNHITVSSTADIAGSYGVEGWKSTKTSLDIYSEKALDDNSAKALDDKETYSIVANESGEAVVWFTCIPQDAATLTVKVEAADGDTYTKKFSKEITLTQGDVNGFGVAMKKNPWVAVDLADIDETMPVVITMATTEKTYALSLTGSDGNALGTTKAPKAIEVSVVNGELSEKPNSDILWNIANNQGNLTICPDGITSKWLYSISDNNGVRLGTNKENGYVWSLDEKSGYLKTNATLTEVRYLGVYVAGPDWRAYTSSTAANIKGETLHFYSNSITEDPTVPKLSVSPTSKTWESEQTDAAVFTVTTNTEGKKDWSVSPETLDWATIVVNKDEGKITVTPNGANTTENAHETTLTVTHVADNSLTQIITLTQSAAGQTGGETEKTVEKTSGLNASKTPTSMDSYISYVNSASNTYSDPMRIYQGNKFTISASGAVITKVEFTCDTSNSTGKPITGLTGGTVTVDSGATSEQSANGDVVTYTISESTTSFAVTASAQFRVSGIKVTYKTN